MSCLGGDGGTRKKAMWLYPKVVGFNPPERWGHSACCLDGVVYVFGGCCGGLHFSDVLTLDLETMTWNSLATTGHEPGTRDSHSAVLVGDKMVVFGGTNGSKKVNDVHILDLKTKEWSRPHCGGNPPSPRESHTATLVGDEKLVIFGGSGEGGANYLNDVHVLDLKTMVWCSPHVEGDLPTPRDSHTAVAIGNRVLLYGGDCGDRYCGEVDVLDMDTLTWSRFIVGGSTPGARAGHVAITIGTKVYVIGGVGDHYYNDVWVLDMNCCSWSPLDTCGQRPQGRFSHTAIVTDTDIAIYGGCGEDERPLNELLILQLGSEHPNGRYNISMCKVFGNRWSQYKQRFIKNSKNPKRRDLNQIIHEAQTQPMLHGSDDLHAKKRKASDTKPTEVDSEQEEHSLSLSQNSSPSQSDQEQNNIRKLTSTTSDPITQSQRSFPFKLHHHYQTNTKHINPIDPERSRSFYSTQRESMRQLKTEQFIRTVRPTRQEMQFLPVDPKGPNRPQVPPQLVRNNIIGAEVHGTVDGAFDSGFLMTANVNGQILRGILFAPGPSFAVPRPMVHPQSPSSPAVEMSNTAHIAPLRPRMLHQSTPYVLLEHNRHHRQSEPALVAKPLPPKLNADLQGVALTLGTGGSSC